MVCNSKLAAVRYQEQIRKLSLNAWRSSEQKPEWSADKSDEERTNYRDDSLCKKIQLLKAVTVVSDGTNESAIIAAARKRTRDLDAVKSFKKQSNFVDPEEEKYACVAFLVVCCATCYWLADAPIN